MRRLYDNSTTVDDEASILEDFQNRSHVATQNYPMQKNHHYGQDARETLDIFSLDQSLGTVIFIHGGYWQWCTKEDFSFLIDYCHAHQHQCILIEYPLAPTHRMPNIVQSIGRALDWLHENVSNLGHVKAVGHSAGAHLLANYLDNPFVNEFYLLSGIYDLFPIQHTHLDDALKLTTEDVSIYSPTLRSYHPIHANICIAYGDQELPELQSQSTQFSETLNQQSISNSLLNLANTNHYTILDHFFQQHLFR